MKRPYVPFKVRLKVLLRQYTYQRHYDSDEDRDAALEWYKLWCYGRSTKARISWLRDALFHGQPSELDHDPALEQRKFSERTGKYKPDANDPNFLLYRLKPNHLQKTTGRAPGAARTVTTKGSDVWLAKKFRKLEQPKKQKRKIPSRPFSRRGTARHDGAGHGMARHGKAG